MDIINTIRNIIGLILLIIAAVPFILANFFFTRPAKDRLITVFLGVLVDKHTNDKFETRDGHTLHIAGEVGAKHWTDGDLVYANKDGHPVDDNGKLLPGKFE